jgi:hypothetical protein
VTEGTLKYALLDRNIDLEAVNFQMIRVETDVETLLEARDRLQASVHSIEAQLEYRGIESGSDEWLLSACCALGVAKSFHRACSRQLAKLGYSDEEESAKQKLENMISRLQKGTYLQQFYGVCHAELEPGQLLLLKSKAKLKLQEFREKQDAYFTKDIQQ